MRTPTCARAAHRDLGVYALGALDAVGRAQFEQHLAGCPACAAELRDIARLTEFLARVDPAKLLGFGEPRTRHGCRPRR